MNIIPEWINPENWDEETKAAAVNAGKTVIAFLILAASKKALDTRAQEIVRLPIKKGPYAK